ncbi:MAG: UPF0182 family protein [Gemmatimonadales bacterium]
MTPRTRRLLSGIAVVVVCLYVGRWSVAFVTERWWAAMFSPAAVNAITRWRLLGLALDVTAILIASCWFALQALLVARAVATVSVTRNIGNLQVREAIPTRYLWIAGVCTGVLLGLITGAGARAWRGPVALAWQGVHYGVVDPLLGEDLGVYVAQLPVWELAHDFAVTLVVLGLAVATMLYSGIGGIKRDQKVLIVHPDARRHLGGLLALFAGVLAAGYLIEPYRIAAASDPGLGAVAALTRIRAAQVMSGLALAVALLSLMWAQRGRHTLLLSGWSVLVFGIVVERIIIPALAAESTPPAVTRAEIRQLESIAWGIREATQPRTIDSAEVPLAIWDDAILSRWFEGDGRTLLGANPAIISGPGGPQPGWLLAASATSDHRRVDLLAIAEGVAATDGGPVVVPPPGATESAAPLLTLADPRLRPDAEEWRFTLTGVPLGGPLRNLGLAWARQAGGMVASGAARAVDWHLDPAERAAAILPMASWSPPVPMALGNRITWVVQGMLPMPIAAQATRLSWRGTEVAGVVPAFVAVMDAVSGAISIYRDPGADSLAASWSRFAPGVVADASALPPEVRQQLAYPAAWLASQLQVLEGAAWGLGRRPGRESPDGPAERPMVVWSTGGQATRVAVFEDPARRVLSALVTASRVDGMPQLRIDRIERAATPNGRELERDWARDLTLGHLRDSAQAAGDSFFAPPLRWRFAAGELMAWQPIFAAPSKGRPALLGIGGAVGERAIGARSGAEVWAGLLGAGRPAGPTGPSDAGRLSAAQSWMRQADSALSRHDLTAFGRAFEELRKVLDRSPR